MVGYFGTVSLERKAVKGMGQRRLSGLVKGAGRGDAGEGGTPPDGEQQCKRETGKRPAWE